MPVYVLSFQLVDIEHRTTYFQGLSLQGIFFVCYYSPKLLDDLIVFSMLFLSQQFPRPFPLEISSDVFDGLYQLFLLRDLCHCFVLSFSISTVLIAHKIQFT